MPFVLVFVCFMVELTNLEHLFLINCQTWGINALEPYAVFREFEVLHTSDYISVEPINPGLYRIINYSNEEVLTNITVNYLIFNSFTEYKSNIIKEEINESPKIINNSYIEFRIFAYPHKINLHFNNSLIYSSYNVVGHNNPNYSLSNYYYSLIIFFLILLLFVVIFLLIRKTKGSKKNPGKKGSKKKLFSLLLFAIFILVSFNVSASELPTSYYFNFECYDNLCKDNAPLFNNETNSCIFKPILLEDSPIPSENNVKNKEEYLRLDNNSKKNIRKWYWECTKVNSTATNELRGEILRERHINLIKGLFRAFLYLILPIVAIIWLISWFGDWIRNRI